MSNSGLGCVLIMMDGVQYQCDPSQYWDPYMGMCLDRTDDCCAQGYYYDPQVQEFAFISYPTTIARQGGPGMVPNAHSGHQDQIASIST